MNFLKDKKVIVLIVVLIVFSISYFILVNKVSYAYIPSIDIEEQYNLKIDSIKSASIIYADKNKEDFSENNTLIIKVQDLIDAKLLFPNENGEILDPMNPNETLNFKVITIKYDNNKYDVKIDK